MSIICYSCGKLNHIAKRCPDIHVIVDSVEAAEKAIISTEKHKKSFQRKNFKVQSPRKKGFNARADFLSNREEALLLRKCLLISPDKIKSQSQGSQENNAEGSEMSSDEKPLLKRHFHSLIRDCEDDIDDDYETEEAKEFHPALAEKMRVEIVNYPKKQLNSLAHSLSIENYMNKSTLKKSTFSSFSSVVSQIMEKNKKNPDKGFFPNKTLLLNDLTSIKDFDKIRSYNNYFPNNNFEKVIEKINKNAEEILNKMKYAKEEIERQKKKLLNNVIDQPISFPNWRISDKYKSGTRAEKKKKLFFFSDGKIEEENLVESQEIIASSENLQSLEGNNSKLIESEQKQIEEEAEAERKIIIDKLAENTKLDNNSSRKNNKPTSKFQKNFVNRSLSSDSLNESIKTLQMTIEKSQIMWGKTYTKFLVDSLNNN